MDAAVRVKDALKSGELGLADLSARKVGAWLGKTTSTFYHHWGSFEFFLYEVSQVGMGDLFGRLPNLSDFSDAREGLELMAEEYVSFAFAYPALYHLMFERTWDWEGLRKLGRLSGSPGLEGWRVMSKRLAEWGSAQPSEDLRLIFVGLHGATSLALFGKANIGAIEESDRDVALKTLKRLVGLIASTFAGDQKK